MGKEGRYPPPEEYGDELKKKWAARGTRPAHPAVPAPIAAESSRAQRMRPQDSTKETGVEGHPSPHDGREG
jgi:hypothetical protein